MSQNDLTSRLARSGAEAIYQAFHYYHSTFRAITAQAKVRFDERDWLGLRADAAKRLELYPAAVSSIESSIRKLFGLRFQDTGLWIAAKAVYAHLVRSMDAWELAETFFNSVSRRLLGTVGVNQQVEFVDTCSRTASYQIGHLPYHTYKNFPSITSLVTAILTDYQFGTAYEDLHRDCRLASAKIEAYLKATAAASIDRVEMIPSSFFRVP
ncbi:MAG: bifunctional isocitrate dehydrogenase kinase/phosphatase [Deltaproteobacteria bacterium]|nr:bifunctional isocitrate dehydrogenase kinase/phosphatase [Deltaproteobacteria bacterium]MBW2070693.1 bifunctional isocitrate dehydrogenase kinase/phosphatase [Deltaproteobacteria bacterium]